MKDVDELLTSVLSGLPPLVIEDVIDESERIVVWARAPRGAAVCPVCEVTPGRVHGYR